MSRLGSALNVKAVQTAVLAAFVVFLGVGISGTICLFVTLVVY